MADSEDNPAAKMQKLETRDVTNLPPAVEQSTEYGKAFTVGEFLALASHLSFEEIDFLSCLDISYLPHDYLLSESFKKLYDKTIEILRRAFVRPMVSFIVLRGPKGAGKTTALLALRTLLTIPTLLVSNRTKDGAIKCYKDTTADCGYEGNEWWSFVQAWVRKQAGEKAVLLVDLGAAVSDIVKERVYEILDLALPRVLTVVAVSGGVGYNTRHERNEHVSEMFLHAEVIEFLPFTHEEAISYCKTLEVGFDYAEELQSSAGSNPGLLRLALSCKGNEEPWKIFQQKLTRKIDIFVHHNVQMPGNALFNEEFMESLGASLHYFEMARHETPLLDTAMFCKSWVAQNYVCYCRRGENIIRMNYPTFIESIASIIVHSKAFTKLLGIPQVKGFYMEDLFFTQFQHGGSLELSLEDGRSVTYNVKSTFNGSDRMTELKDGVLYRLSRTHPAIDYVGKLTADGTDYSLVCIQISISRYHVHKSKIPHLLAAKSKAKSVLDYYKNIAGSSTPAIYAYISTSEVMNDGSWPSKVMMDKHLCESKNALSHYGVLSVHYFLYKHLSQQI